MLKWVLTSPIGGGTLVFVGMIWLLVVASWIEKKVDKIVGSKKQTG